MNLKKLLALPMLLLFSSALANYIEPHWIENAPYAGSKVPVFISTGNLADVVFDERGEIVQWYVKPVAGTDVLKVKDGVADTTGLSNQLKNSLLSSDKGLVVGGLPQGEVVVEKPQVIKEGEGNRARLVARFKYTQGGSTVEKRIDIEPSKFTMNMEVTVTGVNQYTLNFTGVNGASNAYAKGVSRGSQTVLTSGALQNIEYASIQSAGSFFAPSSGGALVIQPLPETTLSAKLALETVKFTNPAKPAEFSSLPLQRLTLTATSPTVKFRVFGGRDELIRLHLEGFDELPGLFSPNVFGRVSLGLLWLMKTVYSVTGAWILTLLILTLLIRLLIWPLMHRQYLSTAEMQMVQPLMKEMNEKYKDNPERRTQETMRLYKEHKINPAAGCLPAIVQAPIFIVLWRVFSNYEFNERFLWLPDLSLPDILPILPALYVAVNVANLWVMTRKTPDMFRQQALFYLLFAFFALQLPSGVVIYYIFSTLIGMLQYWLINRRIAAQMELRKVSKVIAPSSGPSTSSSVKLSGVKSSGVKLQKVTPKK